MHVTNPCVSVTWSDSAGSFGGMFASVRCLDVDTRVSLFSQLYQYNLDLSRLLHVDRGLTTSQLHSTRSVAAVDGPTRSLPGLTILTEWVDWCDDGWTVSWTMAEHEYLRGLLQGVCTEFLWIWICQRQRWPIHHHFAARSVRWSDCWFAIHYLEWGGSPSQDPTSLSCSSD